MGRITEALDSKWVEYVSDIDENRDDPEPLMLVIRAMDKSELNAIQRKHRPTSLRTVASMGSKVINAVVQECVREVKNYRVYGKDVLDGADLVTFGEDDVVTDAYEAITKASVLSAGLRKNFISPSNSSPPATSPSSGDAAGADGGK